MILKRLSTIHTLTPLKVSLGSLASKINILGHLCDNPFTWGKRQTWESHQESLGLQGLGHPMPKKQYTWATSRRNESMKPSATSLSCSVLSIFTFAALHNHYLNTASHTWPHTRIMWRVLKCWCLAPFRCSDFTGLVWGPGTDICRVLKGILMYSQSKESLIQKCGSVLCAGNDGGVFGDPS